MMRWLIGLGVVAIAGAGAFWWWSADEEPVVSVVEPAPAAPPPTPTDPVSGYVPPDLSKPRPRRAAPRIGTGVRRDGVRTERLAHDFTQTYPATPAGVEEAVQARGHRVQACVDVHGRPRSEDESSLGLHMVMSDHPTPGSYEVIVRGALPELTSCLREAMSDIKVQSVGARDIALDVVIPMDEDS